MKRTVTRRYEITGDEIKMAVLVWLRDQMDMPVPSRPDDASVFVDKDQNCIITWSEVVEP